MAEFVQINRGKDAAQKQKSQTKTKTIGYGFWGVGAFILGAVACRALFNKSDLRGNDLYAY